MRKLDKLKAGSHLHQLCGRPWPYLPAPVHVPRPAVGCGDSFAAAVVLGFTRGHSIPAVMALASAVGAATAMGQGAGRNVASADTVLALLQSALPGCEDGRHRDALEVLNCSLSSVDSSD